MICIDNSEWMRNGDYAPSRFQAQADAVNLICGAKTQVPIARFAPSARLAPSSDPIDRIFAVSCGLGFLRFWI